MGTENGHETYDNGSNSDSDSDEEEEEMDDNSTDMEATQPHATIHVLDEVISSPKATATTGVDGNNPTGSTGVHGEHTDSTIKQIDESINVSRMRTLMMTMTSVMMRMMMYPHMPMI